MFKTMMVAVVLCASLFWVHAQDPAEVSRFLANHKDPVENNTQLRTLGSAIANRFTDSAMRLRAVYEWVTNEIAYDCEGLRRKSSKGAVDSVLKNRKALCAGFVNVFRSLCEAAGLECVTIRGFGRSGYEDLLISRDSSPINHSWNAVRLNGAWQLIDSTWASGYTEADCEQFTRQRNDWYYCTTPDKFIWDHFPVDSGWQLLGQPVSWKEFSEYPLSYFGVGGNRLSNFFPQTVRIKKKEGEKVEFRFRSSDYFNTIIINSRKAPGLYKIDRLERKGDEYRYVYAIERPGQYDLQIDLLYIEPRRAWFSTDVTTFVDLVYWLDVDGANAQAN